jgi:hypothetical protein
VKKAAIGVVAVAAVTVATLAFSTGGAQAHTTSFISVVTIHQVDSRLRVKGSVRSPTGECRKHRTVDVIRKLPGPDRVVATVSTGSDRFWGPVSVHKKGTYYAHVDRVVHSHYSGAHTCLSDRSSSIFVSR